MQTYARIPGTCVIPSAAFEDNFSRIHDTLILGAARVRWTLFIYYILYGAFHTKANLIKLCKQIILLVNCKILASLRPLCWNCVRCGGCWFYFPIPFAITHPQFTHVYLNTYMYLCSCLWAGRRSRWGSSGVDEGLNFKSTIDICCTWVRYCSFPRFY